MENGAPLTALFPVWWRWDYGVGLALLVPVKGTLCASAHQDILDRFMLRLVGTVWDGPFLFQHDDTQGHKTSH